jgi:hypothetical protein
MTLLTRCMVVLALAVGWVLPGSARADQQAVQQVLRTLNGTRVVDVTPANRSYEVLFDALLDMTEPPMPISGRFNLATIHPGMRNWQEVEHWAEANPHIAEAILKSERRLEIGLPYGRDNVKSAYQRAGLYADIGSDGSLLTIRFPYLSAFDRIAAYATAESYRLMEGGSVQEAIDLAVATTFVLRQLCNREFVDEKKYGILLLTDSLENMRDMFYKYRDRITAEQFTRLAVNEIPFLRPDRNRLFLPEGDRTVAEAILKQVFDSRGTADPYKFPQVFGELQSRGEPLTRFGAARRWGMIAEVHGSLDASLERLKLIYDDWWRRWRVQEYDPILAVPTQFSRVNPIRYAAVIYTIRDIADLFDARRELVLAVNGTAYAAGLCAYYRDFGTFPSDAGRLYGRSLRRGTDVDPFDQNYDHLRFLSVNSRRAIDVPGARVWVDAGHSIVYSVGQNHSDGLGRTHTRDGSDGDIVVWPPIKAMLREQGLLE